MDDDIVENISDFCRKYGTLTPGMLVAEYIRRSPQFPGDEELATKLGEMMGDLKIALEHVK